MSLATRASLVLRRGMRTLRGQGDLPGFLLLGAQKAGTTSLFHHVCRSPQVMPPLRKEVHYFDAYEMPPLSWYKSFFPELPDGSGAVSGEATPLYLFHPDVPRRIGEAGLNPRFLVILRCPVERAWSHYRHEYRKGREPLGFEEALLAEPERLRGTTDRVLDRAHLEALRRQSYLSRGRYMAQIERFARAFGQDRLLVVSLDALRSDPAAVVSRCCGFLGVEAPPADVTYKVHNAGSDALEMPRVDPAIFRDAFDADLEALGAILPEALGWRRTLHG